MSSFLKKNASVFVMIFVLAGISPFFFTQAKGDSEYHNGIVYQ